LLLSFSETIVNIFGGGCIEALVERVFIHHRQLVHASLRSAFMEFLHYFLLGGTPSLALEIATSAVLDVRLWNFADFISCLEQFDAARVFEGQRGLSVQQLLANSTGRGRLFECCLAALCYLFVILH
jgi:hypothetical protein